MINSAQSIEGSRYIPEKRQPISYERVSTTPYRSTVSTVPEKLDTAQILNPISTESNVATSEQPNSVSETPSPVSISKFVLEAKAIFSNFITGLNQFAVPTKNAQELT